MESNKSKKAEKDEMNIFKHYPSKTYKILPLYSRIFYAILPVYSRDGLTEYLIEQSFNYEKIYDLPRLNKNEFVEYIIAEFNKEPSKILDKEAIYTHKRMLEIKQMTDFDEYIDFNKRIEFNVRMSGEKKKIVNNLSENTKTIGEVLELCIANFIINCDETCYDIFKLSYKKIQS